MTETAAHSTVTVTTRDLATLLNASYSTIPGTRIDLAPVLVYVARGLTADDLLAADNDSGHGVIGDIQGAVRTAAARDAEDSDSLIVIIDKSELIDALMTETLPAIAARLTEAAREGYRA